MIRIISVRSWSIILLCLSIVTTNPFTSFYVFGLDVRLWPALDQDDHEVGLHHSPATEKFLNTQWNEPVTEKAAKETERISKLHWYSEPSIHQFPESTFVTNDANTTEPQHTSTADGDVGIESIVEPGWPWQPWPSSRTDFPALPLAPVMEGRWWPKKSYSTLSFDVPIDLPIEDDLYIWAWLARDQDTYGRYLTFWFDNNLVAQYIIRSWETGFKTSVHVPADKINPGLSRHRVEISINYGGYKDRGWRLYYAWVGIGDGPNGDQQTPPLDSNDYPYDFTELTPRTGQTHCVMEYVVYAGESTILNIQTVSVNDPYLRSVKIYFEDNNGDYDYIRTIYSPGAYQVSLNNDDHPDYSIRKLKLEFRYLPDIDYAKRIVQLGVHHLHWQFEIDYMPNLYPSNALSKLLTSINTMNAYYALHAYHRVSYTTAQDLPSDSTTTIWEHNSYFYTYFDHIWDYKWEYLILVRGLDPSAAGWHLTIFYVDVGIAINDYYTHMDYLIYHEYGHHIWISVPEVYCPNDGCVMTDSGEPGDGWYCFLHWWDRGTY
jgi:hypothetical protein